ncbi:MAG: methyltransferase domain-containing protein [Nitrososphaerales archaeon]|nr:methyltransferase domain-containing protein [Nitrososphaerales archaeon]
MRGQIFACTNKTERECLERMLFSTNKVHANKTLRTKKGDYLFLLNFDSDTLYGVFRARSDGKKDIVHEAWGGKYPYQVEVEKDGEIKIVKKAKKLLSRFGISWIAPLDETRTKLLLSYFGYLKESTWGSLIPAITVIKDKQQSSTGTLAVGMEEEKPQIEATTLWDYPRQSYGKKPKGDNKYPGVTPAFIIYNLVQRYTEPGDLVLDPMAGSGTTIDVCKEEGRKVIAYDISPTRPDIIQNDARNIPLPENSVDMIFIDSPYGDNVRYNDHPDDIGKISSEIEKFYDELEKVMGECHRVLKPCKVLGWLIGDQWVKKKFTPVGFKVYQRLCKYFDTLDVVCVVRRSQTSNTSLWYNRARRFNFYLRGFKYLFIMRKTPPNALAPRERKIQWARYPRVKHSKTNQ